MNEDELKVLKLQMLDLHSKVKNIDNFKFIKENGFKIFITFFLFLSMFYIHVRFNSIEQFITSSSIKNANSIKKQIKECNAIQSSRI